MFKVTLLEKWKGKVYLSSYIFDNKQRLQGFLKLCEESHHFVISVKTLQDTLSA